MTLWVSRYSSVPRQLAAGQEHTHFYVPIGSISLRELDLYLRVCDLFSLKSKYSVVLHGECSALQLSLPSYWGVRGRVEEACSFQSNGGDASLHYWSAAADFQDPACVSAGARRSPGCFPCLLCSWLVFLTCLTLSSCV